MTSNAIVATVLGCSFVLQAGSGIFIPSGPSGDHLFIVVTDIQVIDGKEKVLSAPVETLLTKSDRSCILNVGDHEFIKRPSHIGYRHCRVDDLSDLKNCLISGSFRLSNYPVSADLLRRIKEGFISSAHVARYIKKDWFV